jgi:hypothetical protein
MNQTLNTICQFCNDTGVTPERNICKRCFVFAHLSQAERDARLHPDTCAHGIDNSTGYCARCEDASIERASRIVARLRLTSLGIATALFLTVTAPTDARNHHINPSPPAGCTIVGTTGPDEGFPLAHCSDGTYVYQDLDGDGRHKNTRGRWLDASGYLPMG